MSDFNFEAVLDGALKQAQSLGADAADASIGRSEGVDVSVREGRLETIERDESVGLSLRCLVGQRQAHVSGSDLSADGVQALVERCVAMAKIAPEDPYCGIAPSEDLETSPRELKLMGDDPVEPDVLEQEALEAEAAARSIDGVKDVPSASSSWTFSEGWVAATNGFRAHRQNQVSGVGLAAIAEKDGVMERDYDGWTTRRRQDRPSPKEIGLEAGRRAVARMGGRKIESQKAAVLFDKRVSSSLLSSMIGAISGPAIARGTSYLKDKLGQQIFRESIQVIDNPFRDYGLASRAFDGEGRPVREHSIIENGVLTEWLLNGPSAKQLGLKPNGFASSGFGDPPGITVSNLHLSNGEETPEALISAAGPTLQIIEMFGPSINPNTGDYSVGVAGRWHDGSGESFPVSEITVADNLIDMFARLVPANDLTFRNSTNAPSLLIEGMTLAGR